MNKDIRKLLKAIKKLRSKTGEKVNNDILHAYYGKKIIN